MKAKRYVLVETSKLRLKYTIWPYSFGEVRGGGQWDSVMKTRPFMERLGGRDLLQVRNSVQEADAAVDQHALEAKAEPGRQAPPGRAAGAAWRGSTHASCSTAFLLRCARRLRARPRRSLRSG